VTFEDALEARMRADETITGPIGGRIEWGRRIEAIPAVTLQIVSDPRPQHMKGFQTVRSTDVQIDVWSATAAEAAKIRNVLIDRLVAPALVEQVRFQRAMITNTRGGSEQPQAGQTQRFRGELFRQSIDITFTHDA